ncbi:Gti1/Pac2 family-domain-containing protein [Mycena sp. CBHHK59/15]|nr:Gti1/Pac2 family-domain-containing protein [Mycena sp. CBHHK59/15]
MFQQLCPHLEEDIRDIADAHRVFEAVRLNVLPLIRRRLVAHERAQLKSGNVFVWEESEDSDEGGLVRWTEGRRWSQSRMRGDYLFYEEKIETTHEEKQAKAARRASKASDSTKILPAPLKRKDRPSKVDGLTKQTYSVTVHMPGTSQTRKWHIVAYFSACDLYTSSVVDNYDYLRCNRTVCSSQERYPSHSDEIDSTRGSLSQSYRLVLPPPALSSRGGHSRVSLPPLSSLGYPSPRRLYPTDIPRHRRSRLDRRILDSFRVVI